MHDEQVNDAQAPELAPSEGTAPARPRRGHRFAGATLIAVGAATTLSAYLAAATLGAPTPATIEWSTGGAFAIIAALTMWARCRSWRSWAAWVWLPVAIASTITFTTMNLAVSDARNAGALHEVLQPQPCGGISAELSAVERDYDELIAETWAAHQGNTTVPTPITPPPPPERSDGSFLGDARRLNQEAVYQTWVDARGPQLQQRLDQLRLTHGYDCGPIEPEAASSSAQTCKPLLADVKTLEGRVRALAQESNDWGGHGSWSRDVPPRPPVRESLVEQVRGQGSACDYWVAE